MSKKTVTFKMPVRDSAPLQEDLAGNVPLGAGEIFSASAFADATGEEPGASPSDQWVLRSDSRAHEAEAEAAASPATAATALAIDLAAARELPQAAALMFLIPPMVGWFWLFEATNKYWSAFAGLSGRRASYGT